MIITQLTTCETNEVALELHYNDGYYWIETFECSLTEDNAFWTELLQQFTGWCIINKIDTSRSVSVNPFRIEFTNLIDCYTGFYNTIMKLVDNQIKL